MKQTVADAQKAFLLKMLDCKEKIKQQIKVNNQLQQQITALIKHQPNSIKTKNQLTKIFKQMEKHAIKKEQMNTILLQLDKAKRELEAIGRHTKINIDESGKKNNIKRLAQRDFI